VTGSRTRAAAGAGAAAGTGARRNAGITPAVSTQMCSTANATLLSVAGSRLRTRPVAATANNTPIATSAGATVRGWRSRAPCFGVTTNDPRRRSSTRIVACTWIQKLAACSARARNE
jgi:hypothetical protein